MQAQSAIYLFTKCRAYTISVNNVPVKKVIIRQLDICMMNIVVLHLNTNNNSSFSQILQIGAHVTYKEIICKHSIQMS